MNAKLTGLLAILTVFTCACNLKGSKAPVIYKGLYTSGPNIISFKDCDNSHDFYVSGDTVSLQKQYAQLTMQKPYIPVYVEVEGSKVKSGKEGVARDFDSTLVITKVIKITKQIPQDLCN